MTYYVVQVEYVGPNQGDSRWIDYDRWEISTEPELTNMGRQPREQGWCGTTNDVARYAHGAYETLEAARAAIADKAGKTRIDEGEPQDLHVVEVHRVGALSPMSVEASSMWVCGNCGVTATTTDDEIEAIVAECARDCAREGARLDEEAAVEALLEERDELRKREDA
jgi:hypothetical protein